MTHVVSVKHQQLMETVTSFTAEGDHSSWIYILAEAWQLYNVD